MAKEAQEFLTAEQVESAAQDPAVARLLEKVGGSFKDRILEMSDTGIVYMDGVTKYLQTDTQSMRDDGNGWVGEFDY